MGRRIGHQLFFWKFIFLPFLMSYFLLDNLKNTFVGQDTQYEQLYNVYLLYVIHTCHNG